VEQINTSPRRYFPNLYEGVLEIDELSIAEDTLFKTALEKINALWRNGYLATCDADGIEKYESMLGITANPEIETLEFRRNRLVSRFSVFPSYTMPWLRIRLNELLGIGNWDAYVDFERKELVVETLESASVWTHEVAVTINQIKPASLIFISAPMNCLRVVASEEVSFADIQYNYKLGSWPLGSKPFTEYLEEEVVKMAETPSIQPELLKHVAHFTARDVAYAFINGKLLIPSTDFLEATSTDNLAKIRYEVFASSGLGTITNVKLQDASRNTLAEINVAIDNSSNVRMSHKIKFEEGTNAETA